MVDSNKDESKLTSVLAIGAYICISSSMLIVNKAAVAVLPHPYFVTNLQVCGLPWAIADASAADACEHGCNLCYEAERSDLTDCKQC